MNTFLIFLTIILLVSNLYFFHKWMTYRKSLKNMSNDLKEKTVQETNTLLSVSNRNRLICEITDNLNSSLIRLREIRQEFLSGNRQLNEIITGISHDLRTPITAISGYLDLLRVEENPEKIEEYYTIIKERLNTLKELTDELFEYSALFTIREEIEMEEINLVGILEESLVGFFLKFKTKGIEPALHLSSEKLIIKGNRTVLQRIFNNIFNNVVKYSDGDLSITENSDGEMIISNSAHTLDGVEVGKLFNRFYTVNTARNSTGFGLYITKILMEQMNGSILADYQNGQLMLRLTFAKPLSE